MCSLILVNSDYEVAYCWKCVNLLAKAEILIACLLQQILALSAVLWSAF